VSRDCISRKNYPAAKLEENVRRRNTKKENNVSRKGNAIPGRKNWSPILGKRGDAFNNTI